MGIGLKIVIGAALCAAVLAVVVAMGRTRKPLRHVFLSLTEGICAIAAVDILGVFTGVSLGFSWFSALTCAAFGIPGVVALLLMRCMVM